MGTDDAADAGRLSASLVLLNPTVVGAANVQDALATMAGGLAVLGTLADAVFQDAPTTVAMDGASHTVICAIAAPPAWMNTTGAIIEAGVYGYRVMVADDDAATTPGLFGSAQGPTAGAAYFPVDNLQTGPNAAYPATFALGAADLPFQIDAGVGGPADDTATVAVTIHVQRLVAPA